MSEDVARFFDAMADSYDQLEPWSEHLYAALHAILRTALRPPPGGRALDAGCGTGFQSALLDELGYETHGVDISTGLLAVARRRLRAPRLACASVEVLPYADATFDAVSCCGSTLSFVERPECALLEFGRVLRPGGYLLLECEHKWSLDLGWALLSSLAADALGYRTSVGVLRRQLVRPLREGFWLDYPAEGAETMRLRLFTHAELSAMLRRAGCTPCRRWGLHSVTNFIPSTVLHRPRLPRALGALYRGLRALDGSVQHLPVAAAFANSVVILARRSGPA
jgi:ubiquinone/menaquinone biosynthesis C-methylase UbiE